MIDHFKQRRRPDSLEGKFQFDSYDELRDFLDRMAEDCEILEHHPNVSFGRDYASLVIYPASDSLGETEHELARRISARYEQTAGSGRLDHG